MGIPGKIGDLIEGCQWRNGLNGRESRVRPGSEIKGGRSLDGGWKKAEKRTGWGPGQVLERWDGTDAHQPPKREKSRRVVERLKKKAGDGVGRGSESMLRIRTAGRRKQERDLVESVCLVVGVGVEVPFVEYSSVLSILNCRKRGQTPKQDDG